jgi:hypothetical protein
MAFREYQRQHPRWVDPFLSIETPEPTERHRPDALPEEEGSSIFHAGGIQRCYVAGSGWYASMFWVELRQSELWDLRPEDLD